MHSSMISRIAKAIRYAQEPDRFSFQRFALQVRGTHQQHTVSLQDGQLACTCEAYAMHGNCSHTIAVEKVLGKMLPCELPLVISGA
jgi:SWIM zinc finger